MAATINLEDQQSLEMLGHNGDRRAHFGFLKDHGSNLGWQADAAVGGGIVGNIPDVETDACMGEAHPVRHLGPDKLPARRDGLFPPVATGHVAAAAVVDRAIEIGALVFLLLDDSECASRCRVGFLAGRNGRVDGHFITGKDASAAFAKSHFYPSIIGSELRYQFLIGVNETVDGLLCTEGLMGTLVSGQAIIRLRFGK